MCSGHPLCQQQMTMGPCSDEAFHGVGGNPLFPTGVQTPQPDSPSVPSPPSAPPLQELRTLEAQILATKINLAQRDEAEKKLLRALQNGCPTCQQFDRLSRRGSTANLHNLRCERCNLRIGWTRIV